MERYAIYKNDYNIIDKLMEIKTTKDFYYEVTKLTKRITSDRSIGRWQILSDIRYDDLLELEQEKK